MEDKGEIQNPAQASVRLESIIASAMDAIISIDSDQKIILFNPAAERMFGVPASAAIGQRIERFIPERFRTAHAPQVRAFGATGATHRRMGRLGAVRGLRASGEEFPAEASISHVETDRGQIFTVIMRDISERVAADRALTEARENLEKLVHERTAKLRDTVAELKQISYNITHDMRAPLRAIQSFAGILEQEAAAKLSPAHRQYLDMMKTAAARMDALIRDVLTYNSVVGQEATMTEVDADSLLRSMLATYEAFGKKVADIQITSPIPKVLGNEALLTQCFSNLLSNAVKFARPNEQPRVRVSGKLENGRVCICFQDSGIGIPSEFQEKIFGIFERLSNLKEGTGIGLAVVRKAAERMGGRIWVESEEGRGSSFCLELPAVPDRLM